MKQAAKSHGGLREKESNLLNSENRRLTADAYGTTSAYRIAKLRRDHPEIADRLERGEFPSVAAAVRVANGEPATKPRKAPTPLEQLERLLPKLSESDLIEMARLLLARIPARNKLCYELNDARRHMSAADREEVKARVERVAAMQKEGKSQREIAEAEGIDRSQVRRDLAAVNRLAAVDTGGVTGSCDPVTPPPTPDRVIGRDGVARPAKNDADAVAERDAAIAKEARVQPTGDAATPSSQPTAVGRPASPQFAPLSKPSSAIA